MPPKPWSGRFQEPTHQLVEAFTASLAFDCRLAPYDLRGSIAHARMLAKQRILTQKEAARIVKGLEGITREIARGKFPFSAADEDIHMAIERRLLKKIGPVAGKLHTGRSRNDQVALDLRLYVREVLDGLQERIRRLQRVLLDQAEGHAETILPGYTHMQRAQPIVLAHHLLAYVEMLERDRERLADARARVNVCPLGAGALAGTTFPLDRAYAAKLLGFDSVCQNSLDAVADRDFLVEFLADVALLMTHLSRLGEELVLWSTFEFGFVEFPDAFATGSSMMPQKKNPDVAELVRGKTGRVFGHLLALLTILKGMPLSYNRDLQEDKEPLFDAVETAEQCLEILAALVPRLAFKPKRMRRAAEWGYLAATDLADYLASKGLPFREAHAIVGRIVAYCLKAGKELTALSLAELKTFSPRFGPDALQALTLEASVARRNLVGGTAPAQVRRQIRAWAKRLKA